jgi:antitoxin MazE
MAKTLNGINKTSERIFKSGNSKAISLSKQTIQLADFEVGDKVEVQEMNGGLFIKKKEESSIEDKITNFFKNGGKYTEEEIDFGESVGREI